MTKYNETLNDIVIRAYRRAKIIAEGQNISGPNMTLGYKLFNLVLHDLRLKRVWLWNTEEIVITPTSSSVVKINNTNYTCYRSHTSNSVNKPGDGDDWKRYWIQKGSNGNAWTANTAYNAIGDFNLTNENDRIMEISHAYYRRNETDYPLTLINMKEWHNIYDKTVSSSIPSYLAYQGNLVQGNNLTCFVWPIPQDTNGVLFVSTILAALDMESAGASHKPVIPTKWIDSLIYLLSRKILEEKGGTTATLQYISRQANNALQWLMADSRPQKIDNIVEGAHGLYYED